MKKKSITLKLAVAIAIIAATTSFAQTSLGTDCGCPPLASRTTVDLASLADGNGNLSGNPILTCDKIYKLSKKIYVPAGQLLTIKPGTVVKGLPGAFADDAPALIVTRAGRIDAVGSATCPIIFTADADPLDGTYPVSNKGQWGGIILLGRALNNLTTANTFSAGGVNGLGYIDGISHFLVADSRHWYGAPAGENNDLDNSGILNYISIRHAGRNGISALSLGSVGRATNLEHIEVVSAEDDGIEFFGGTVDLKWATVLFSNDDQYAWDLNWRGRGQFWFGLKLDGATFPNGDNGMEGDADDNATNALPRSHPKLYNITLIGNGAIASGKGFGIQAEERTEGEIYNSIFVNYKAGLNLSKAARLGQDAYDNWIAGSLIVKNSTFNTPGGSPFTIDDVAAAGTDLTKFTADGNLTTAGIPDAVFAINSTTNVVTDQYNATPAVAESITGTAPPVDGFFTVANYRGAFSPGFTIGKESWLSKWTLGTVIGTTKGLVFCPTDLNHDGITNGLDINLELGQFLKACGK